MQLFRRFLVIQALIVWQGGFLFYAAVVVPIGTDVVGSWMQGQITRHVTDWMNGIGMAVLPILAWDQLSNPDGKGSRRARWGLWLVLFASLLGLIVLHPVVERLVDGTESATDAAYRTFYLWHRVYLYLAAVQWVAGLGYVVVTLWAWIAKPQAANLMQP
jgi:hypothetical protein